VPKPGDPALVGPFTDAVPSCAVRLARLDCEIEGVSVDPGSRRSSRRPGRPAGSRATSTPDEALQGCLN
jgi:hypothetical protein